jgi:hypothetical protein
MRGLERFIAVLQGAGFEPLPEELGFGREQLPWIVPAN